MNSKTSFFSRSIFEANIKRFWWISAGLFVWILAFSLLPLTENNSTDGFSVLNLFAIVYGVVVPPLMFAYLNSANSVTALHAFPIKRSTHYITNIISYLVIMLVPVILGYLIAFGYIGASDVSIRAGQGRYDMIKSLCETLLMNGVIVIIFSGASLLGIMATGNTVAAIVFGAIFAGFPYYTEIFIKGFLEMNVYGIWRNSYLLIENFRVDELNAFMGIMFVVGVLCYIGAWFLYKYRKLEVNGDIIAFKWLKPVFMAGVSVYMGFMGYFYLSDMFEKNIFLMLPFGIIGIIISYMLSKKAFTFKGIWKPMIVYIAAVAVLYVGIKYDLTGFEKRVPDIDDIESVNVVSDQIYNNNGYQSEYVEYNRNRYYFKNPKKISDYAFTDQKDIENVVKLHKYLTEGQEEREKLNSFAELPIVYKLKNGKTVKRVYTISYYEDKQYLEPVYTSEIMRNRKYYYFDCGDAELENITIGDQRLANPDYKIFTASSPEAAALVEALREDMKNLSYETLNYDTRGTTYVDISFVRPLVDEENKPVTSEEIIKSVATFNSRIIISPEHKNTFKLLREYGLFDNVPTVEQVKKIEYKFDTKEAVTVTDREKISEVYNYCAYNNCNGVDNYRGYDVQITLYNDNGGIIMSDCYRIDNTAPAFLYDEYKKYFEDENGIENTDTVKYAEAVATESF